jgi:hypothetical protein
MALLLRLAVIMLAFQPYEIMVESLYRLSWILLGIGVELGSFELAMRWVLVKVQQHAFVLHPGVINCRRACLPY